MLIALHCSSKAQKKKFETFTIKAICECTINIIDRNIKVSDQEKTKSTEIVVRLRTRGFENITNEEEKYFSTERRCFLSPLTYTRPWNFGGYPLEGYTGG